MTDEEKLNNAIIKIYTEQKYNVYQCHRCGYGQGHQIVYCPKCGDNMKQHKKISALDLGIINKDSRNWNYSTLKYRIEDETDGLVYEWIMRTKSKISFIEYIGTILNWE